MDWKFQLLNKPYGGVTEGPVWDGEAVYFTHIPASRIMRYDPRTGEISQWRSNTNHTNGLAYDAQGRLFGCCSAGRAIVRFDSGGKTTTIANRLDGQRLNTPNDLAIDRRGRVWFTNPWNAGNIDPREREELDHRSVLRADPQLDGAYTVARVTFDTTMPNGILVSADQRTLYVAESNSEATYLNRELRAYPIKEDGSLGPYTILHTFGKDPQGVQRGIDGMCLDADGNIVATAGWELGGPGPLIYVFSPTGRVIETHPVPASRPTNCCFGGPDLTTLYVTTTQGHFFRVETDRVGWAIYP
ncbi:MAG: SMP-30/gluconolactonase/LRE family protein [Chloroflexota bacterium]